LQLIELPLHLRLLRHAGPTALAHGLFLVRVVYDQGYLIPTSLDTHNRHGDRSTSRCQ